MALTKAHSRMIEGAAVNVLDYGAVGDGVTDDTAAIQAAVTYAESVGKSLYFPATSSRYIISSTINICQSVTVKDSSPIGAIFSDGDVEIETSVVPAFHINSNVSPAIMEHFVLKNLTFVVDGLLGFTEGVVKLTRTRNFEIDNLHIKPKAAGDCGFLLHLDGSYVGAVRNCTSLYDTTYLFDTFVDSTTGQQDTVLFESCKKDGLVLGFIRSSTSGRHNYKFDTVKCITNGGDVNLNQYATTTLSANASIGATSITLTDASSVVDDVPFFVGDSSNIELVIPASVVGSTVTLKTPLRTAKTSGDSVQFGAIGIFATGMWNITATNCHSESGSCFLLLGSSVQNVTVDHLHCSSMCAVLSSGSDNENINVGSIRFQGGKDWGLHYGLYLADSSSSTERFNFFGDIVRSVSAATPAFQNIRRPSGRWMSGNSTIPAAVVTSGTASIGTGVSVSCSAVNEYLPTGTVLRFDGGGVLTLTSPGYCGYTSITGDLTTANIASGETASLGKNYLNTTIAISSADVSDEDDARSTSIFRMLVDLVSKFSIRGDGSVKGERFFSWSSREDSNGPVSVPNFVTTEIIPASFFDRGDVVLISVFSNAAPFNFRGSCIVYRGSSASQHEVETIGTPVSVTFSTTGGNVEITQTSGNTRNTYVSAIRYGKGLV